MIHPLRGPVTHLALAASACLSGQPSSLNCPHILKESEIRFMSANQPWKNAQRYLAYYYSMQRACAMISINVVFFRSHHHFILSVYLSWDSVFGFLKLGLPVKASSLGEKKIVNKAFSNHSTLSWINHCFYDIHYMLFFFFFSKRPTQVFVFIGKL